MSITLTRGEAQQVLDAFEVATTHFAKDRQEILAARETLCDRLAQPERKWHGMTDEEKALLVVAYYRSNWDRQTAVSLLNDYEAYLKERTHD